MTKKIDIPKKKQNFFFVYDLKKNEYNEIKYLTQHELSDGWIQKIPQSSNNKLINHFNITLAYLPENLWTKLKKIKINNDEKYKIIKNGLTRYTISETNQDEIMIKLFKELKKINPNVNILQNYINDLDISQHSSWLVIRAIHFINYNVKYIQRSINNFDTN